MSRNVFISFRYSDGYKYKDYLSALFDDYYDTVDFSEDIDRSNCAESTIKNYLYSKLRRSSITIVILTPDAINHRKNWRGEYDDWMYDEIRYSLEDRSGNRTNGLIAVYTPEAEKYLIERNIDSVSVKDVDNLFRKNMMNVKDIYKKCPTPGRYDANYDSYCSLVAYGDFVKNFDTYINIAIRKRDEVFKYDIAARMQYK